MAADSVTQVDSNHIPNYIKIPIKAHGIKLSIAAIYNQQAANQKPIVLFLHGLGGTKEDYADFLNQPNLSRNFSFLAYDAPGCGQTTGVDGTDDEKLFKDLSIPFLADTAVAVLDHLKIHQFHLAGHSMGGLTALLLAHNLQDTGRVLSFINIKGNLSPEDCFLSRQVFRYPSDDPEFFFTDFVHRTARSKSMGSALYATSLRHKVRAPYGVITSAIFRSMVQLSDEADLMEWFLQLGINGVRRMFMFGEENRGLSYLSRLKGAGVELAMVPHSGHFVMYSNPVAMWQYIETFLVNGQGI